MKLTLQMATDDVIDSAVMPLRASAAVRAGRANFSLPDFVILQVFA